MELGLFTFGVPSATALARAPSSISVSPPEDNDTAKIAIGVAVPVGILLLLDMALGFWFLGRSAQRKKGYTEAETTCPDSQKAELPAERSAVEAGGSPRAELGA